MTEQERLQWYHNLGQTEESEGRKVDLVTRIERAIVWNSEETHAYEDGRENVQQQRRDNR